MPVCSTTKWPLNPLLNNEKSPIKPNAIVPNMSGAPKIEPTPISWLVSIDPEGKSNAIIGTEVSGRAVPTAAKIEPVTPSDIFNFCPKCSKAFVKTSAAIKMMSNIMHKFRKTIRLPR